MAIRTYLTAMMSLVGFVLSSSQQTSSDPGTELSELGALLQQQSRHEPKVFQQAVRIVNDLESAPSCHRLAAKDLIQSCQSLQMSDPKNDQLLLDGVKSMYAARLAVCELVGAGAAVPQPCFTMTPAARKRDSHLACGWLSKGCGNAIQDKPTIPKLNQRKVDECLRALESRPQWWTSYSNAHQNAVIVCQAARGEIEREELLQTYRYSAESSQSISEALLRSTQQAHEAMALQQAFARAISNLHATIVADLEFGRSSLQTFLSSVQTQVEAGFQAVAEKLTAKATAATESIGTLETNIDKSTRKVHGMHEDIDGVIRSITEQHNSLAETHKKQLEASYEQALALRSGLVAVREQQVESVSVALSGLQIEMQSLGQLMAMLYDKHVNMDIRLDHFDKTMRDIQSRANMVDLALKDHREAQDQLFDNLTTSIEATSTAASVLAQNLERINLGWLENLSGLIEYARSLLWPIVGCALLFCAYGLSALMSDHAVIRRVRGTVVGLAIVSWITWVFCAHARDTIFDILPSKDFNEYAFGALVLLVSMCLGMGTAFAVYLAIRALLRGNHQHFEVDNSEELKVVRKRQPFSSLPVSAI